MAPPTGRHVLDTTRLAGGEIVLHLSLLKMINCVQIASCLACPHVGKTEPFCVPHNLTPQLPLRAL